MKPDYSKLLEQASLAYQNSYAPYSHFRVGAALLTQEGKVLRGCNVENSSFGAAVCAERVAIFKAYSEGERNFSAIAVSSSESGRVLPCGICRQVLWELAGDIDVIVGSVSSVEVLKLSSLYPEPFQKP